MSGVFSGNIGGMDADAEPPWMGSRRFPENTPDSSDGSSKCDIATASKHKTN